MTKWGVHVALFVGACATTTWLNGPAFSATLMSILFCHELGHYVVGRIHKAPVSLPYFIPLPFSLGTMGAVIQMDEPVTDRNQLFDVGASGPIAGLVVAIPLLVIGLTKSHLVGSGPDDNIEGPSILYMGLKHLVFGRWLPGGGADVDLHPMAFAAWVGLLVTMINLIPVGQLDGGHVARAAIGNRHEAISAKLHAALPIIGLAIAGAMFTLSLHAGHGVLDSITYATYGLGPWCAWFLLLTYMKRQAGEYHPPVGDAPLSPGRRRAAWAMLVIFLLIATPVPFRPPL